MLVTLEGLEALQGDSRGAGDELQQPRTPLLIIGLHGPPEPLDYVAVGRAVLQTRVGLPVVDVYLTQTTDNELDGGEERKGKKAEMRGYWGYLWRTMNQKLHSFTAL